MTPRPAVVAAALVLPFACAPLAAPPGPSAAPVNACSSDAQCASYVHSGATPTCANVPGGGSAACLVVSEYSDLVLTVSLSEDSYFAPGQTLVLSSAALFDFQCATTPCGCSTLFNGSYEGKCAQLPAYGVVQGAYVAPPNIQSAQELDWNLGNAGLNTTLPVHVTYRPLWPPSGSLASAWDAASVGLPVLPIEAQVLDDLAGLPPGPNGGVSISFQGYMQPADYECTISPDPPFDAAFPPDVQRVTIAAGSVFDDDLLNRVDVTQETPPSTTPVIPAFDLSRIEGLDGWTAYLQDTTTLRPISNVATLSGTKTHVTLATNHHPPASPGGGTDALTGAQLVLQPPSDQPIPTGVFPPIANELPIEETYPPLPAPATVEGVVTDPSDGAPVEADLAFEAIDIYEAGQQAPNDTNFTYTALASARVDPTTGDSIYKLSLPPGDYRLTIRPTDAAHAVTVVQPFTLLPSAGPVVVDFVTVTALVPVQGHARVADGRPLAQATVSVVPRACSLGATTTLCLPRGAQTLTDSDGFFALELDQGSYELQIKPQDGTRLPWVTQSLLVGPVPPTLSIVPIPAPVYAGLTLLDAADNPIVDAIVRAYLLPAQGPSGGPPTAVEIGQAITDSSGRYDLYLAPTSP